MSGFIHENNLTQKAYYSEHFYIFNLRLQNRISYRQNLFQRRMITNINNIICVLSENLAVNHLFLIDKVSYTAWYSVFRWLGTGTGRRTHLGWLLI
jgi:hypothetical protein